MGAGPIIVAHRGLHHVHPENSIAAFKAAWDAGIIWCECDVHFSADGTPYILHDETLDRTADGVGPISNLRDAELKTMKLKNGEFIPALADVSRSMTDRTALLVELKSRARSSSVDIFNSLRNRQWMFQSFDAQDVEWAAKNLHGISTCFLVDKKDIAGAEKCVCDAAHADFSALNEAVISRLRGAGKKVGAWTVNHPNDIRKMCQLGVDMIITDDPELAANIAKSGI